MWTPDKYAYKTGALGTWTIIPTSAAKDSWKFFAVADGKLWGGNEVTANNLIGSTASPTSAANFTTVAVGGTDAPITAMIGDGDTMLVCKTNGVWAYYPDGTLENLTPEFEARRHPHNFFNSYNWNGRILLPLGEGGLYQLHQGVITDISLKFYAPNETKLHGPISAISAEPSACYFLVRDATNSKQHVVKGEIVEIDGVSDWRFHHLAELAGIGSQVYNEVDGSTLLAEGVPSGTKVHHRLWVAAEQSTTNYPHFLPGVNDDEDGFTNDTDCIAQFTEFDYGLPNVDKTFKQVHVESANLGAGGRQYGLEFRVDAGSWLTTLKDAAGNSDGIVDTSPTQTMTFPDGTTGKIIEFRIKPALTSVGTTSPEFLSLELEFQLRPSRVQTLPVDVYLADGMRRLDGSLGVEKTNTALAQMRTWAGQAKEVKVTDAEKTARQMMFLPGTLEIERVVEARQGRRAEYRVRATLVEV